MQGVWTDYPELEQKLWSRFEKLVMLMRNPNDHEAFVARDKAKQHLATHNLKWDDRPALTARAIDNTFPKTRVFKQGKWRVEQWHGQELRDVFRTSRDKSINWPEVVAQIMRDSETGLVHLDTFYAELRHRPRAVIRATLHRGKASGIFLNPKRGYWKLAKSQRRRLKPPHNQPTATEHEGATSEHIPA